MHVEGPDAEVYARMPRLMMIPPTMWLIYAHRGRKNHAKVVSHTKKLLRSFGFFLPSTSAEKNGNGGVGDEEGDIDVKGMYDRGHENSLMTIHVVTALKFAADAYRALGKNKVADECDEAAKLGYSMMTGFENDPAVLTEAALKEQ